MPWRSPYIPDVASSTANSSVSRLAHCLFIHLRFPVEIAAQLRKLFGDAFDPVFEP